jgi:hypothetical protein
MTIVAYINMTDWTPTTAQTILSKWDTTSNQRSYQLTVTNAGALQLALSSSGSAGTIVTSTSSANNTFTNGTGHWIRVTYTSGAGATVAFYTSNDDIGTAYGSVTWTALGTTQTGAATAIFNSTSALTASGIRSGTLQSFIGRIYRAYLISGTNPAGAAVAQMLASEWVSGGTWTAGTGEVWTINGGVTMV